MVKPFIPIISDEWSHEFNEVAHVSLVHAKYGGHHLQKELSETESCNDKSKNQSIKADDQVSLYVLSQVCKYDLSISLDNMDFFIHQFLLVPQVYILEQGPPPKLSC